MSEQEFQERMVRLYRQQNYAAATKQTFVLLPRWITTVIGWWNPDRTVQLDVVMRQTFFHNGNIITQR